MLNTQSPRIRHAIHEPNGRHQSRRLLRPHRPRRQRRSHPQPRPHPRRLHPNHVCRRKFLPGLVRRPRRPPQAHDVGKYRPRHLYDDGRHPSQLQGYRERTCYLVGVRCLLLPVYAHLRSFCQLYPLVLRPGNPATTCTSERDGRGDIFELDLGKHTPSYSLLPLSPTQIY